MAPFELLDHDADLGLTVEAASLSELFAETAKGLTACLTDLSAVGKRETRRVEATGTGREELFVHWLKEWLYLYESEGFLVAEVEVLDLSDGRVVGEAQSEVRDAERHPVLREVKAVTYHQVQVEPSSTGWRGRVILDV